MLATRVVWAIATLSLVTACGIGRQEAASPTIITTPSTIEDRGLVQNNDQSVTIHLVFDDGGFGSDADRDRVWRLEDRLIKSIDEAGVGTFDGDGFGDGGADLFAYGPDADALWAVMEGDVRTYGPEPGSFVLLVYGTDAGADEHTIPLP